MESMVPAQQFIPNLNKDGSIDTLRGLLTSLANRLQWRSNQMGPLFPPAVPSREAHPADHNELEDVAGDAGSDGAGAGAGVAAATEPGAANVLSDDGEALSLPDAVLARAVLCPSGVVVALASTTRKDDRRKNTADGGGGGGGVDDGRWRREVRALAEGRGGTITVGEGAAAVDRVLKEIKAWETRGRGASTIYVRRGTGTCAKQRTVLHSIQSRMENLLTRQIPGTCCAAHAMHSYFFRTRSNILLDHKSRVVGQADSVHLSIPDIGASARRAQFSCPLSPRLTLASTRCAELTFKNFPCLRGTLEGLTIWGSGPRRESLRRALRESEAKAEVYASPG